MRMRRRLKRTFRSKDGLFSPKISEENLELGSEGTASLNRIAGAVGGGNKAIGAVEITTPERVIEEEEIEGEGEEYKTPLSGENRAISGTFHNETGGKEGENVENLVGSMAKGENGGQEAMAALTAAAVAEDKKERMLLDVEAKLVKPLKVVEGRLKVCVDFLLKVQKSILKKISHHYIKEPLNSSKPQTLNPVKP